MRQRRRMRLRRQAAWQRKRRWVLPLLAIPTIFVLALLVYRLPPIYERLSWRIDELRTRITYALNPPDEAIFVPEEQAQVAAMVEATLQAANPTGTPTLESTTGDNPSPTATGTITPTPLPERVFLEGVTYVDQRNRWNYCGPANLAMGLSYWGWVGTRDDIARVVKPGVDDDTLDFVQRGRWDKNVMPYEMAGFVEDYTELSVVVRSGGDLNLLKHLVANGYPVIAEKGYYEADYTGKIAWLGHYQFVTGYDEAKGVLILQDTWLENGNNLEVPYEVFLEGWRSFNYLFMVVYPPAQEGELFELLGPWADQTWANQHALEVATEEALKLSGIDEFFAWFNIGTSYVNLLAYGDAAFAYDYAFVLYANLEEDDRQRPYRIMWYQTGPYWAYYYTGRYQDTINLAETTLYETIAEPTLEESLYWRGLAREALGNLNGAIEDYREAVRLNPNFAPGWQQLTRLGVDG